MNYRAGRHGVREVPDARSCERQRSDDDDSGTRGLRTGFHRLPPMVLRASLQGDPAGPAAERRFL